MTSSPIGRGIPTAGSEKRDSQLAEAAQRVNEELYRRRSAPMNIDPTAVDALLQSNAELLADVGQDSIRLARKSGVRTVDESHVNQAVARLGVHTTGQLWVAIGAGSNAIGGLAGGIAASSAYAINFSPGPHTTTEITFAILASVIGAILLTFGIVVTILRSRS